MNTDEIEILAKEGGVLTQVKLEAKLVQLQSLNWRISECIVYVKFNQHCSLDKAKKIVVNSPAYTNKKDDFINHQQEMHQEFLGFMAKDVSEIKMIISQEVTRYRIKSR